ncbi:hypothetical protein AAFC00_003748 [Neodothiora populina]|uniref:Uncharacterized protein n=1 Tax=Neodothiora populina TaxID=2781224 RepID=A0ABR3PGF0_9PEZI
MPAARTTTTKPSLMSRLRNPGNRKTTTKRSTNPITGSTTTTQTTKETTHPHHTASTTTRRSHATTGTTTATPVHHHRRKTSMGDKVSGAMMKVRGSLTRRPGLKAAGTRRMHGTDGKGSHHRTY